MKKFWKNLCACALTVACGINLSACGKDDEVNKDLDGDGNISVWETMFGTESSFHVDSDATSDLIQGDIVNISSADELMAIGSEENIAKKKYYFLNSDIDLGGREVAINLGLSEIYGNGHIIKNFKFGKVDMSRDGLDVDATKSTIQCLFYNGEGVYNVRLFAGMQKVDVSDNAPTEYISVSPFFNVGSLSGIEVRGRIDINGQKNESGRQRVNVDSSLLYSGKGYVVYGEEAQVSRYHLPVNISNVIVEGVVSINTDKNSKVSNAIGGIASTLANGSSIYHVRADVDIVGNCSMFENYIGGIVGQNRGFVSTANFGGKINLNNELESTHTECVGGIVGYNDALAEIKNCRTNSEISIINTEREGLPTTSNYHVGGIAGVNSGGVINVCESGANITLKNLNSYANAESRRTVGAMCGYNIDGIISYNICKGSLNVNNVNEVSIAQVAGRSERGYLEKIITLTTINLDNLAIDSTRVNIGMVTTFDYSYTYSDGLKLLNVGMMGVNNSPSMSKILVDGKTTFAIKDYLPAEKGGVCNYNHGLRHTYQGQDGMDEDSNFVFSKFTPKIFDNLYYTPNCLLYRREVVDGQEINHKLSVNYIDDIKAYTQTPNFLIDYLDFKNYLNHNEVSIGSNLVLNDLTFTISNDDFLNTSFFGDARYNGELSYFDYEFEDRYDHDEASAFGYCKHDTSDELFSFLYHLITNNNGKTSNDYLIKVSNGALAVTAEDIDFIKQPQNLTNRLIVRIKDMCNCLGVTNSISLLNEKGREIVDSNSDDSIKYVQFTLLENTSSLSKKKFTLTIDVTNLERQETVFTDVNTHILSLTFKSF